MIDKEGEMVRRILYLVEFAALAFVLAGCRQKEKTQEDYENYLKKLWVVEDWHGGEYRYHAPFSFTITKIEGKNIEGNYSHSLGIYSLDAASELTYMGVIEKGTARCMLYEDNGLKEIGSLELTFLDSRRIEGKIIEEEENVQRKYVFRPYTLNDIDGLYVTKRFQKEIDTWGKIGIAVGTVEYQSAGGSFFSIPAIYIIDESDDILYEFRANGGYQTASEFYEMDVADYNGDGLDDIKIVTYFPYEPESILIERIFYQTEDYLFKQ